MLATPGDTPESADWVHEVKWDGMRVLADIADGQLRLFSRGERDITDSFPELTTIGEVLQDALLDGEIIAMVDGTPSLTALRDRMHVSDPRRARTLADELPVTVMGFDLLRLYGVDLLGRPHSERRATLDRLALPADHWQLSPLYSDGPALFAATRERGLEGVVSKRRSSTYHPGRRSSNWIKAVHYQQQPCLVGGWRPEANSAAVSNPGSHPVLGAVLVGVPDETGALRYTGRVGAALSHAAASDLLRELRRTVRPDSPFADAVPAADASGAQWCDPRVIVDVRHLGWTPAGRLRQAVLRGVRSDLEVQQVHRE